VFVTYFSDDGPQKPSASMYRYGQALPPQHWYQKRVGWFGRTITAALIVGLVGFAGLTTAIKHSTSQTFAAQTSKAAKLNTKSPITSDADINNIVDLQPVLDKWNADHKDQKWAAVATSLSGPSFDARINADKPFESASIYKLFLTIPLFQQVPVEQQPKVTMSVNGSKKSIATCVDLMLRLSDNPCGEAAGDYVNWSKAGNIMKQKGFTHTMFGKDGIKTSASDTAAYLQGLSGDMFTRPAKDSIMKSLYQQRYRDGIPAGCPGCTVANKTGQINDVVHDAAIVQYKGGTYILVIFSENGSFKQIAQLTGQIQQKILDSTK
jgi:beta-lactamase class A